MKTGAELISRGEEPLNQEMPFSTLEEFVTPAERFYVRCHFPIPQIDAATWRLHVAGAVASPLALTLEDLRAMPSVAAMVTMECAGNGRSFLEPKVKGVEWDLGAVGNAEWTGVLLREVLERAGAATDAAEVILEGADQGALKEPPRPPGEIRYARSLPLEKAKQDVLLAYAMNGEPLSRSHGFPLRAVVPGWFGMASVKWLQRMIVTHEPFHGYYQSIDYSYWAQRDALPSLVPLRAMRVKAQIARPHMHEVMRAGSAYRVHGAAWGGDDEITNVEFSSDGGENWCRATLLGEPVKNAWRFWECTWSAPARSGAYRLIARATDAAGRTQPRERCAEYGSYMVNHWLPIEVEVR